MNTFIDEIYKIVDTIPNKDTAKNTTSNKFKKDLIDFFSKNKFDSMIEFGCWQGNSTLIYSYLFNHVLGVDLSVHNVNYAKERTSNRDNVQIHQFDVYSSWTPLCDLLPNADVLNLDAMHDVDGVIFMITNAIKYFPNALMIMDDYGHVGGTIKLVIDAYIENGSIEVVKWIGEDKGFMAANGKAFIAKEGLIFKFAI